MVACRDTTWEFLRLTAMKYGQDINENDIARLGSDVLQILLADRTTGENIFWATSDYKDYGEGYSYFDPILPELITGDNCKVIMPRVLKSREKQESRSKDMAEVFTPSWICNAQNNLVDEAWFGRKNVFNREIIDEGGIHDWIPVKKIIAFPKGKSWTKYVGENRLEIACGEAPYLVSRYDTTTGNFIPIEKRIGLLDRKLHLVSQYCDTTSRWLEMAQKAYKSTYGYEWQGDNLLLAREALLYTFIEYFEAKFNKAPQEKSVKAIAEIISWNIWQMDGLRGVVPNSCDNVFRTDGLFDEEPKKQECPACKSGSLKGHIGRKCIIRDWSQPKDKRDIQYVSLIK